MFEKTGKKAGLTLQDNSTASISSEILSLIIMISCNNEILSRY